MVYEQSKKKFDYHQTLDEMDYFVFDFIRYFIYFLDFGYSENWL